MVCLAGRLVGRPGHSGAWVDARVASQQRSIPRPGNCSVAAEWNRTFHLLIKADNLTCYQHQPSADLSNRTPELVIQWDGAKLGITGQEVGKLVLDTDPRIVVARATGARSGNMASTVGIVPYQMMPGDEKVIADRLYALLSKPPKIENPAAPPSGSAASIAGQWDLVLDFVYGSANHVLMLEQDGGKLVGTHQGEFAAGELNGTVAANTVRFQSSIPTEGTRVSFQFTGTIEGEKMQGTVGLGEYGEARWTAEKHKFHAGTERRG